MNLNKVFILGRLTATPELRKTPSGQSVTSFAIVTNEVYTDKDGQKKENTQFHNIVVWGKQAEVASTYLTKGSLLLVEGNLKTREYEGKDGMRRVTEVVAERIQIGPKPEKKNEP